ncbi:hypothetical protein H4S07_001045 [Coemansia furcata]|uniref:Uncharacterized protein n=1 Tax=Coemansia furcata TaxID=417177 RepID=A0ACC1LP19_9FUNG|nr:hypothetical protein H4S07_001045 [Coemansia furcata]
MRVPFFRSKAKTDADDIKHSLRAKKGGLAVGVLDGIASESELSSYAPATPMSSAGNVTRTGMNKLGTTVGVPAPVTQTARAIADQVSEMEAFLATIDGFQGEARRLFPENMALDQILNELRDECRRRVDYMTRVSAPPAWMAHQRQSSSSSTIIAGGGVAPGTPAIATRRATQSNPGAAQVRSRSAAGFGGIDSSPISTATVTSSSSGSSSGSSTGHAGRRNQNGSFAENKNNDGAAGYFSRHQPTNTARKALGAGSPPSSPTQSPSLPASQTVGRRDSRVADQRRKTAPQSMIVAGSVGEIAATRAAAASRAATSHAATMPKLPRASMALPALDSPRFTKPRTSSIDNLGRPLSFADVGDANFHASTLNINSNAAQLAAKGSLGTMRAAPAAGTGQAKSKPPQQHTLSHSGKIAGEYVFNVKLAGHKIEAAVSSALQTSLISLQLAKIMGMHIVSVPNNSRVWSSGGRSWPVMGEVVGLPFVCGNMTFTHSFKIVQGNAGTNDMTRDIMLGNDFCVCNHGRIKDDKLHLEQLSMPITVPVRQIPAN